MAMEERVYSLQVRKEEAIQTGRMEYIPSFTKNNNIFFSQLSVKMMLIGITVYRKQQKTIYRN